MNVSPTDSFDVAIIGGGAVGASLAIALSEIGYRVALLERDAIRDHKVSVFDERHLAFSHGTRVALEGIGVWSAMQADATAVNRIHVCARGRFGSVLLDAREEGLPALGYVLPAQAIGRALYQRIEQHELISVFAPAEIVDINSQGERAEVSFIAEGTDKALQARLIVGADGAESAVRRSFAIDDVRWEYDQSAVIANVGAAGLEPGLAYERFIDDGAIALLPRSADSYAVVCSVANPTADLLMSMSAAAFSDWLTRQFGGRLCFGAAGPLVRYPLVLVRAAETVKPRLVLIGNAAHFLHPVAAQGFNLSMRDVAALTETLAATRQAGRDPGDLQDLLAYAQWRKRDERTMVALTDGMVRLFTNPLPAAAWLRQTGMLALGHLPGLRRHFTHAVSGRSGRQPALIRGVPVTGLTP